MIRFFFFLILKFAFTLYDMLSDNNFFSYKQKTYFIVVKVGLLLPRHAIFCLVDVQHPSDTTMNLSFVLRYVNI